MKARFERLELARLDARGHRPSASQEAAAAELGLCLGLCGLVWGLD